MITIACGLRRVLVVGITVLAAVAAPLGSARAVSTSVDPSWMTNGKLYAMAEANGVLYLGGQFKQMRETPIGVAGTRFRVDNLGAIDLATGVGIKTFKPAVTHSSQAAFVRALAVAPDGSALYVGGRFDAIAGVPVRNLAKIDLATGQVDPSFAPLVGRPTTDAVYTILVSDDGSKLYVGGNFKAVNGERRRFLAAFGADGSLDPAWTPSANSNVRSLAFSTDRLTVFAAGNFDQMNGVSRQSVARLDAVTGALHPWAVPGGEIPSPMTCWSLTATSTRLFVGCGLGPNFVEAFRLDNGTTGSRAWKFSTVGNVQKVELGTEGLFVGGHFGTGRLQQKVCGNQQLRGLMLMNPATGAIDCSWIPQLEPYGDNYQGVWDIDLTSTHVWFAGSFTHVNGTAQQNVARMLR
ncbi:MAG: hypothetical protein KatS3mg013_0716 [Actinomycetota bacterium]|jgi:hypothetical protein|nr:MAG: hypothetical protein KatS3mg013_0716 [Actinomycetota bacterium]